MREYNTKNKKLNELSFDDLYMDAEDELYPNIRQALSRLKTKMKNRKRPAVHTGELEDESFNISLHTIGANRLRHTGI